MITLSILAKKKKLKKLTYDKNENKKTVRAQGGGTVPKFSQSLRLLFLYGNEKLKKKSTSAILCQLFQQMLKL